MAVSNFALPSWWEAGAPAPYDFLKKLTAPFTMTAAGYSQFVDLANAAAGWQVVNGKLATPRPEARARLRASSGLARRFSTYEPGDEPR